MMKFALSVNACAAFFLLATLGYADSVVVFNEIMYHPETNEAQLEWVELHNQMAVDVDLSEWRLAGGIEYAFPDGSVIPGHGYAVIAASPATLASLTGLSNVYGPFSKRLSNSGETLRLYDTSDRRMDELAYADRGDWPPAADGSGASLAKRDENSASAPADNWTFSSQLGGTPGAANDVMLDPVMPLAFNELAPAGVTNFWLEIVNTGDTVQQLADCVIRCSRTNVDYVFPTDLLSAGGYCVVTASDLGFVPQSGDKLFLYSSNRTTVLDGVLVGGRAQARSAPGTGQWLYPSAPTPGSSNLFLLRDDIVINEIMYHAPPTYAQPAVYQHVAHRAMDSVWKYFQGSADLGTNWRQVSYDDGAWASGAGLFHRNTGINVLPYDPTNTLLNLGPTSYYFRTTLLVTNTPAGSSFIMYGVIDDGAVIYLNGAEIARFNITGTPTFRAFAQTDQPQPKYVKFDVVPTNAFVMGTNVLAVEVHQARTGLNDVCFGLSLVQEFLVSNRTAFVTSNEEWLELYNRGAATADLSLWRLGGGIAFDFPPGTMLASNAYLVVARNVAAFQAQYPGVPVLGNYSGKLGNSGDIVILIDADGNPVNTVRYYDGKPWPQYADGGGSSLELIDPYADNSKPEAWAASDESHKVGWRTYAYRDVADNAIRATNWHEFVMGLLDAGEVLVDDISVIETPADTPLQLIQNGSFSAGASKWRIQGTHRKSAVQADPLDGSNNVLRLVAEGPMYHCENHAETTLVGNRRVWDGREYEISFRARWIAGSPQLHTRLTWNRLPRTTILDTPTQHGTPGARNSRYQVNIGPTFDGLQHEPVVPGEGQPVTVRIHATDPNGVAACRLWWTVNEAEWLSTSMSASNAWYHGTIPGAGAGQIVNFYVESVDGLGATSCYPRTGRAGGALYIVQDNQVSPLPVHNVRIIMRPSDFAAMLAKANRTSDAYLPGTVVYDEATTYYDVGVRLKGRSSRRNESTGFRISFNADQLFRGVHAGVSIDRAGRWMGRFGGIDFNKSQEEILVKHIANRAGHIPSQYDDLIKVISQDASYSQSALLLMGRYARPYLQSLFDDDGDGSLYNFELVYYSTTTLGGGVEDLKNASQGAALQGFLIIDVEDLGLDQEYYRMHFQQQNARSRDDYSRIIDMARAFSLTQAQAAAVIGDIIDEDAWMRLFAFHSLIGIFDTYNFGGNHNMYFYVRPKDQRVVPFPVDMDWAFDHQVRATNAALYGGYNLQKIITLPRNLRRLYGHFLDIMARSYNMAYMGPWCTNYFALTEGYPARASCFTSNLFYIRDRADYVRRQIPASVPFAITTHAGQDFSTNAARVNIAGTAWFTTHHIALSDRTAPLDIQWSSITTWVASATLVTGTNFLEFVAYDYHDQPLASDSITVYNSMDVSAPPLVINEILARNTSINVDEFGEYDDWIELYNCSTSNITTTGLYLSDDFTTPAKWALPLTNVPPYGFLLIWADGTPAQGPLHASFQLSGNGEEIGVFYGITGLPQLVHGFSFGAQMADVAFGLYPDGETQSLAFLYPTPASTNILPEPMLSLVLLAIGCVHRRR